MPLLLGKTIFHTLIDYNICLLLSVIFNFLAFLLLVNVKVESKETETFDIKKTIHYFNNNKVLYFFLFVNFLGDMIWGAILGMPMLLLTNKLFLSSNIASFFILGLGIGSSILSMLVVKYLRFKNDQYNLFVKQGLRIVLYFLIFFTGNKFILLLTLVYLFLTDCTHSYLFAGYFINHIKEEYSLLLTTLKYCSSLLGRAFGTFLCGLVFNLKVSYFIIPALIISIIHYVFASILLGKRENIAKS